MEEDFLKYLLYITLTEIREHSYQHGNERFFCLTDLLHNIPFQLGSEEEIKEAYCSLKANVKDLKIEDWLDARKIEFFAKFPKYSPDTEK